MKKSVLIVEDDRTIRENLNELLTSEGYTVLQADNGVDGLELIRKQKGDCVVLLDLQMPLMDGREVLNKLKEETNDAIKNTPLLVFTAVGDPSEGLPGLVLKKPIDVDALLAAVEKAVGNMSKGSLS